MKLSFFAASCWVYSRLLCVYPPGFRNSFRSEMIQVFRDECRAVMESQRPSRYFMFWLHILRDLVISASTEWLSEINKAEFARFLLAASLSVWCGLVDFRSSEVQNAVLLILISTFLFGVFSARTAWVAATVIGLGVPAIHYIASWAGVQPPYPVVPGNYATFLALVPAIIGNIAGKFVRWFIVAFAQG